MQITLNMQNYFCHVSAIRFTKNEVKGNTLSITHYYISQYILSFCVFIVNSILYRAYSLYCVLYSSSITSCKTLRTCNESSRGRYFHACI